MPIWIGSSPCIGRSDRPLFPNDHVKEPDKRSALVFGERVRVGDAVGLPMAVYMNSGTIIRRRVRGQAASSDLGPILPLSHAESSRL